MEGKLLTVPGLCWKTTAMLFNFGYSWLSFWLLIQLPVDEVTVDKSMNHLKVKEIIHGAVVNLITRFVVAVLKSGSLDPKVLVVSPSFYYKQLPLSM